MNESTTHNESVKGNLTEMYCRSETELKLCREFEVLTFAQLPGALVPTHPA